MHEEKDEKVYLIFRVYDKSEIKDRSYKSRYYGWTTIKDVKNSFLKQRDKHKYNVIIEDKDTADSLFDEESGVYCMDEKFMINFIKLPSSKSDLEVTFLTTASELHEAEIKIQKMMIDQASLESIVGITDSGMGVLRLFVNLKDKYAKMLFYLGYRPRDLDVLFNMASEAEEEVEYLINQAYDGYAESPQEEYSYIKQPPGLSILDDISNKILYSIEAFIKVLREDL